jgi:hypothetical protein
VSKAAAPAALAEPLVLGSEPVHEAALVNGVSQPRYSQILARLSGAETFQLAGQTRQLQTRWALDTAHPSGINLARDYVIDRFQQAGCTIQLQDFTHSVDVVSTNVIGVRQGTDFPAEIVVVGAHYDARAAIPGEDAPGAEDNASGVAGVLHLAELLESFQPKRTVHFVAFGCEEYGLLGSKRYVQEALANGDTIVAALTMDMISAWVDEFGLWIESEPPFVDLVDVIAANTVQWTPIPHEIHLYSFGSDHVPFLEAGIPAILAIDIDWDQYADYHLTTDTFEKTDPALGTEITKVIAGSVADIAGVVLGPTGSPSTRQLALVGNTPNPFNPRTTLEFTLPAEGPVRLEIFDTRGRRIRVLVDGTLGPGAHSRIWDGTDESGLQVASGVYLARLQHPRGARSHTLTLVR